MKTSLFLLFSLIIPFLSIQLSFAQAFTPNDSFEGPVVKNNPPPDWHNCYDNVSTVDTQPCAGIGGSRIAGTDGNSYISIVTRQLNPPGTVETVWAVLLKPMLKGHCYDIRLDYCISSELYGTLDWIDYYFNHPARLQILGMNDNCNAQSQPEVLFTSDIISGYTWETHDIRLQPKDTSYSRIALRAQFIAPGIFYNSAILVDNLRYQPSEVEFIRKNGLLSLPESASGIRWFYNDSLVEGADSTCMPFLRTGIYRAEFFSENNCLQELEAEFKLDIPGMIELYPNPTQGVVHLKCIMRDESKLLIRYYDMAGKLVRVKETVVPDGLSLFTDDISDFPPGTYYIKCIFGKNILELKVVKI